MKSFLKAEYPFYYDIKRTVLIAVLVFVLSISFSLVFEPFDVNLKELKYSYFIISIIHSSVSLIIFILSTIVIKVFRDENKAWLVLHEILFLLVVLTVIGGCQFLIRDLIYLKNDNWSFKYLYEEIRNTLSVGGLLIFIITSINIERLRNIYHKRSNKLKINFKNVDTSSSQRIAINTLVKSDDFTLNIDEFIYAKSDKNYVEISLKEEKILKRMTIKSLEEQLICYNFILRTHRSYLLNLNWIDRIKGNTQGYQISLKERIDIVPVSRSIILKFENRIKEINT